jgi:hypothetical protein
MFGFDLRQAQPSAPPLKVRVTDIPMRSPGEIVRHIVTGEIVGDVDIPGISAVDSIGSMRLAKPLWTQSHDRGAGLGTGIGMGDWNPFLPVIYSSTALLLVALALAVVLV